MVIQDLIEKISNKPLNVEIGILTKMVDFSDAPINIPGYCACDKEKFGLITNYVAETLCLTPQDRYSFELEYDKATNSQFNDFLRGLHYDSRSSIITLVQVTGIETFPKFNAHFYDQCMKEYMKREDLDKHPPLNPKKIVIMSNISDSCGIERQRWHVQTAKSSQHKYFIWDI